MVDSRKFRTSKYLKPGVDVDDPVTATVSAVFTEQMRDGDDVLFASFDEFPKKQMRLNVGALNTLADISGTFETDDWVGLAVELYVVDEPMAKSGKAIRMRKPGKEKRARSLSQAVPETAKEDVDGDIPW